MPNGTPIGRTEAEGLVQASHSIKTLHDGYVQGVLTGARKPTEAINFYGSGYNGYIFDKQLVERFFPDAQYLLVLIGALPKKQNPDGSEGMPTVLLAGCVDGPTEGTFKTLNITNPASQHPPKQFLADFPPAISKTDSIYEIVFSIK